MPSPKYEALHEKVLSRPGASERLAALRRETLAEIGLYELRRALERSQTDVAAVLGITQSAVSQLERGGDIKVSTLRQYVRGLGAELRILAVFPGDDEETAIPIALPESNSDESDAVPA